MSPQRPKSGPQRPTAEFGEQVVQLAKEVGKSKRDIIASTKSSVATLNRLVRGDGSLLFAFEVKELLKTWGADIGKLPPIGDEEVGGTRVEDWLREWIELGRQLHRLASDRRFQVELERLREVIRAHELVAEGTDEAP